MTPSICPYISVRGDQHTCTNTDPSNSMFLRINTHSHMYTHRSIQPGVPRDQHTATHVHSQVHPTRCSQGPAHSHTCTLTGSSNPVFPGTSTQPHMYTHIQPGVPRINTHSHIYTHRSIQPGVPRDQHTDTHAHSQVHPTQCSWGSAHRHTCTLTGPSNPVFLGISTQPHMCTHRITQPGVPRINTHSHIYTHRSIQPGVPRDQHTATHVHSQGHPTRCSQDQHTLTHIHSQVHPTRGSQGSTHRHTCTLTGPSNPVLLGISTQTHMYTHRSIQPSVPGDQHTATHVHSQDHPTRCSLGSSYSHTCTHTGPFNPLFLEISTHSHMYTDRSIQPSVPRDQHTATHVHSQVHPTRCSQGSAHSHTCHRVIQPGVPRISTHSHMYTHRSIQPGVPTDQHTATHVHSQVHPTRYSWGSAHSHTCTLTSPSNPAFPRISTQPHMYTQRFIQPGVPRDQHTLTHVHSQVHPSRCSQGSAHTHTCTLTSPSNPVFPGINTQTHMYTHRSIQPSVPGDQHTDTHVHSQVHPTQCS